VKYWITFPFFWPPRRLIGCQFNGGWLLQGRNFGKSFHFHQVLTAPIPTRFIDLITESNLRKDMQPERDSSELLHLPHWMHTALSQWYEYIYIYIHIILTTVFFLYSSKYISKVKHSWCIQSLDRCVLGHFAEKYIPPSYTD